MHTKSCALLAGAFAQLGNPGTSPSRGCRGGQNSVKTPEILRKPPATLDPVEDRSPPRYGLISPRTARCAAWVLIAIGLAMIMFAPWPSGWTLAGAILIFTGLGADWRSRQV